MTQNSASLDFTPERCQHRTSTGRQCRSVVAEPGDSFCARHAASEPSDTEDFSAALTDKACRFQNAQGVNHSLGALYTLLAQGRISPRRASALAYISSLLLRTLPAIDTDLYPHSGKPGFSPSGEPTMQDEDDANTAASGNASQTGDPIKSQKPN